MNSPEPDEVDRLERTLIDVDEVDRLERTVQDEPEVDRLERTVIDVEEVDRLERTVADVEEVDRLERTVLDEPADAPAAPPRGGPGTLAERLKASAPQRRRRKFESDLDQLPD